MVVVDSRANWTRAQTVCEAIEAHPDLDLHLVLVSQMADWPIADMTTTTRLVIRDVNYAIHRYQPDIVVAMTDRYETLAIAQTAMLNNVRIAHIQGGELTGTIDESIRHAVTKLSHIHFPATWEAAAVIVSLGENDNYIWMVGCPASDLLLRADVSQRIIPDPYILFLMHPVATENDNYSQVLETLRGIGPRQLIAITPNHDEGSASVWNALTVYGIRPKSYPPDDYINLLAHAEVLVGNSSSGIREACYFGTPVIDVGTRQHLRYPRGRNVTHVDPGQVGDAVAMQLAHGHYQPEYLYGDGHAGERIADILATCELPPIQKRLYESISHRV